MAADRVPDVPAVRERLEQLDGDELRQEYRRAMSQVEALLPRLARTVEAWDQHVLDRRCALDERQKNRPGG